jgi:ATP-dependent Clp protease ATP-binding subunit ClpC
VPITAFTETARWAVVLARSEAHGLGQDRLGTEHLLLGLLGVEEGLAARVLGSFEVA